MSLETNDTVCPLCRDRRVSAFHEDPVRQYVRCEVCQLVFVPMAFHVSCSEEKAEYDLHQNSPNDHRYRRFLSRLFEPVQARLTPESRGLDFGSGPGPTLSVMFEEAGYPMAIYDPFFAPDTSPLSQEHDFVTASEVVEHFRQPRVELENLWSCVKPGGLLGIMTKLVLDREAFARWHYKDDRTHVSFYSRTTFEWLAAEWHAELTLIGSDVILLRKQNTAQLDPEGASTHQ